MEVGQKSLLPGAPKRCCAAVQRALLGTLVVIALTGCGPNLQRIMSGAPATAPTPSPGAARPGGEATPASPAAPLPGTASQTSVQVSRATQAATAAANGGIRQFRIAQSAASSQDALKSVRLVLLSGAQTGDALTLRVAFQNTNDQEYHLIGAITGYDAVLVDAAGNEYQPRTVSQNLKTRIDPEGGFGPGAANVGDLTFPRPTGGEPYQFRFPSYAPILFRLDTPLTDTAPLEPPPGEYPINIALHSSEQALRQVELRVHSMRLTEDRLTFDVAFANTGRQGYTLLVGPNGSDARLLDAEGTQYKPSEVSDSLRNSIAPQDGWQPGQAHAGTLTFPRPRALQEVRLVFPAYDALTIRLDAAGVAETRITSPTGGTPQPTPTPGAREAALASLDQLLATQAKALLAHDAATYLSTFDPALHDQQRRILERVAQVPLVSYTVRLAPDADLPDEEPGILERLPVEINYTLQGVSADNAFAHVLRYTFKRSGTAWQVSAVEADENPPFWLPGDVALRTSRHFLIFARPEAMGELPTLEQEAEAAYAALAAHGLPLEERYVAYFTADQDDFAQLTGRAGQRILGLALSRYEFNTDTIRVNSRAFYINGEAFAEAQNRLVAGERQTTVTHELVHLALASQTRPFTPPWLVEGTAVYYSEDLSPAKRRQLLANGRLDSLSLEDLTRAATLGEHDLLGEQTSYEYVFSGETFAYLVERYGEAKVLEFYRSFADVPARDVRDQMPRYGGSELVTKAVFADLRDQLTADAVQQFFGVSLAQLDADVKAWLREA